MYEKIPTRQLPLPTTAPIKYFSDIPQGSIPGARLARSDDTKRTYCPEKISATLAPRGQTMGVCMFADDEEDVDSGDVDFDFA